MEFVVVAVFLGIIVLGIYGWRQSAKRLAALEAWAAARQWSFDRSNDASFDERYSQFANLARGRRRYAYNVVRGASGTRPFCGFDYHYETTSTDKDGKTQTHHHHFSAVIVEAGLPLKPLYIRREGFFDRIGEFLGLDDIDFESAEFSRRFHVTSPDRRWAFDVLHQEAMEFLLGEPDFTLEFQSGRVMATGGGTFSPEQYDAALGVIGGLLDRLPKSVLRELDEAR